MPKTKRDKYRIILDKINKLVNERSNADQVRWGNTMYLSIPGRELLELLERFEDVKSERVRNVRSD